MCLNPRLIVNPSYVKWSAFKRYPFVHMPHRDFFYSRDAFDTFDYKLFHPRRNSVTSETINDYYAYNSDGETIPLYIEVPCGKCRACINSKRIQIKHRLILEQYSHGDIVPLFLTLTYNDANLPGNGVSVSDIQLFLKRLRSHLDYHYANLPNFRYVCFSEYGSDETRTLRPHYHLLLFGIPLGSPRDVPSFERICADTWGKGFVWLRMCDYGCFNYVSKYVCKGSNVPLGKNPNFRLSSRRNGGLGVPAFEDESLYLRLLESPHPLLTVKVLGKVFKVFVPKSIRDRLCRSPRQFVPVRIQKAYKLFCHKSAILRVLMNDFPEFLSHCKHYFGISGVPAPPADCIVPLNIFEKFAALEFHPIDACVPYYMRNRKVINPSTCGCYLDEYVKLYKILDSYCLDFDKMYHFSYLRGTVYERWKLSLVRFIESSPDLDPLSVHEFNAIIVDSANAHPV